VKVQGARCKEYGVRCKGVRCKGLKFYGVKG